MRVLIFWDSITEWYYDLEKWGWANMLKTYFWKQNKWIEVATLWISWDEIPDILKRFEVETKAFTEKYNDETIIVFAIWINDSVTNIDESENLYSIEEFSINLDKLINLAKKYTERIVFLWLTNVDESLVSPFPWSTTWKCYKNDRIKKFNGIIKEKVNENDLEFIDVFWAFKESDLFDWIHPNSNWHNLLFEKVKDKLEI